METQSVKGFKGFDKNLKCRDYQFEIGKTFIHNGKVEAYSSGFHFCENPIDVLHYYDAGNSRFCEVEGSGKLSKDGNDSKVAVSELNISAEITLGTLVKMGIEFVFDKVKYKDIAKATSGYESTAATSGTRSTAATSGFRSTVATSGDMSTAATSGNESTAATSGYRSTAVTSGSRSTAATSGFRSTAATSGSRSTAATSGDESTAATSGTRSTAVTSGTRSTAIVEGNNSIAISTGRCGRARGIKGCWIVLTERDDYGTILSVQSFEVDGEKVKENTLYKLKNGQLEEVI